MAVEQYMDSIMRFYAQNTQQVWLVVGGIILVILGVIAYKKYEYFKTLEVFKGKDLDERVTEDLFSKMMDIGQDVEMDVYYGDMNKVGTCRKILDIESPSDGTIAITSEEKQEIGEEMGTADILLVIPSDGIKKWGWIILDKVFGMNKMSKFMVVNRDTYRTEAGRMVINDKCNMINRGGVLVQSGHTTENVVNEIVTNETYENILQSLPNFVEKINQFDSQHSQRLNRMDKLAEMDKKDLERMLNNH